MPITRREWAAAAICWAELLTRRAEGATGYSVLTAAEGVELTALSNTILPETDTAGAEQAGTVAFIDAALAGFDAPQVPLYRAGLSDVTRRCAEIFPPAARFSSLTTEQRSAVMKAMEQSEFFAALRTHTVLAYFGNPKFGWKLLGRDAAMHFSPPFGFYDAEIAR